MIWQDAVMSAAQVVLLVALIPMLFHDEKPPLVSSLMTGTALFVFSVCLWTLGVPFAALILSGSSGIWFALAYQRIKGRRNANTSDRP